MKTRQTWVLVLAGVILSMGLIATLHPREGLASGLYRSFSFPRPPLLMRLTGVLRAYEARDDIGGLNTFPVSMYGEQWIFQTEKAQTLTGSLHGSSVLARLFPPRLRFVGTRDVRDTLRSPEIRGRTMIFTGYLYFSSQRFWVTQVDEPPETP